MIEKFFFFKQKGKKKKKYNWKLFKYAKNSKYQYKINKNRNCDTLFWIAIVNIFSILHLSLHDLSRFAVKKIKIARKKVVPKRSTMYGCNIDAFSEFEVARMSGFWRV